MNDTAPAITAKSSSRKWAIFVVLAILAVGAIAYMASKTGLDKALVKEAVDNFAAELKASSNDTLSFSYGDIAIEGGFRDRHAVIKNPVLQQSPEGMESEQHIYYTTDAITLHANASDLSSMKLFLSHPIKGYKGSAMEGEAQITVIQKSPITAYVDAVKHDGIPFVETRIELPDSMLVDGPESERDQPWNQFTLGLKAGGTVLLSHSTAPDAPEGLGKTDINLHELIITPQHDAKDEIRIAQFVSRYENVQDEKGKSSVSMTADVGPITGDENALPYGPIEFALNASYEGLLSSAPEDFASNEGNEKALKIETLSLKAKDTALYATADFVSGSKDILPVGTANITLENVPFILEEMRKHKALDASKEALFAAVVSEITGTKLSDTKDLTVDVKRVRDGAFQIGNSTFEELMALVLRSALEPHNATSAPAPALPETPEKKAE